MWGMWGPARRLAMRTHSRVSWPPRPRCRRRARPHLLLADQRALRHALVEGVAHLAGGCGRVGAGWGSAALPAVAAAVAAAALRRCGRRPGGPSARPRRPNHLALLGQLNAALDKLGVDALLHKQARAALAGLALRAVVGVPGTGTASRGSLRAAAGRLLMRGAPPSQQEGDATQRSTAHPPLSRQRPVLPHHVEEERLVRAPHRLVQVAVVADDDGGVAALLG